MWKEWDIQTDKNWWISFGFHIDHTDPSITLHLPGVIISAGICKQPGFKYSLRRKMIDICLRMGGYDPDEVGKRFENLARELLEKAKQNDNP